MWLIDDLSFIVGMCVADELFTIKKLFLIIEIIYAFIAVCR